MKLFRFLSASRRQRTNRQPSRRMFLEALEERLTPSTLIPVPNRRDHVYDATRQILYISTAAGTLQRYDVAGQQLLTPFTVGGPLAGLDLTQDAGFAYVADTQRVGNDCFVRKVNLDTGAVTTLTYTRQSLEGGAWDLAIANNGRALFDGTFEGSGWVPLRQIDLNTDTLSIRQDRPGGVSGRTHITRGADRGLFFLTESGLSSGPVFTYDAGTNSFPRSANLGSFHNGTLSAVSRDGQLIAVLRGTTATVMDRNLNTVRYLADLGGGVAFHPTRDLLLAVDATANQVVGINTVTWTAGFRVDVGEDVPDGAPMDGGVISVSPDGGLLFLSTPTGVRVIDLPNNPGVVTSLALSDFPQLIGRGLRGAFVVTARDAFGDVVPSYTGTVTFTSTDLSAVLPADYTFTPADQGRRTFAATFNGPGTFSLMVRDVAVPALTGTQTGIVVHSGAPALIPVANRRDHVWDAKRGMLYISTVGGVIERYHAATGTLLTPYRVGTSVNGLDITPDARFLYALEALAGGPQGLIYKIDLITGTTTTIRYAGDAGGWDIAIANNGRALFDTRHGSVGSVELRELALATGAVTNRRRVNHESHIWRASDGSLFFITESSLSGGPVVIYDAATNTFPRGAETRTSYDDAVAAVSRDGALIAVELGYFFDTFNFGTTVMDRTFRAVRSLGTRYRGGLAFDPVRDILYAVDSTAGVVVAFDSTTWAERFRLNVGETYPGSRPFGNGILTASGDGTKLFLSTPAGVRILALPGNPGVVSRFVFSYPRFTGQGVSNTFTVTAVDAFGSPVTNYTGTVTFSSTDLGAQLPANYTFEAGDQGRRRFTAALNTVGAFALTVRDVGTPAITTTQTGIVIHNGAATLIPVPDRRDHVWDHLRNRLYLSTAGGLIERYDLATRTLLEPWNVGGEANGLDITPKGAELYVTQGGRSAVQGMLHRINLDNGSQTAVTFNLSGAGGWGLAIANNNKVLFDSRFEGSGSVQLRELNLATGSITDRRGVTQDTHIARGRRRGLLFFAESNVSSGPVFTYDAATNTFPRSLNLNVLHDGNLSAVNRDDTLIALELGGNVQVFDPNLASVRLLNNLNGGLAFDPLRNVLYAAQTATGRLLAYDTQTWAELLNIPVGEPVTASQPFGNGEMTVSADGRFVFLSTPSGVRLIEVGRGGAPGLPAGGTVADGALVKGLDALALVRPTLEERPRGTGAVATLVAPAPFAALTVNDPVKAVDPFVQELAAARTEARSLESGDWIENWLSDVGLGEE